MPVLPYRFNSFTTGEISERVTGRTDIAKYYNSCNQLENWRLFAEGGVTRRPGTRYAAEVKDSSAKTLLLPFQFNVEQAYILEFGNLYMRVYKDGGQVLSASVPYEIVTPYTTAQLFELMYVQLADVMYIAHSSHPPAKLARTADDAWTLSSVVFKPPATLEVPIDLESDATLGAVTGSGITLTAVGAVFLAGDLDRTIEADDGGMAVIVGYTSTTIVTVDITQDFSSTTLTDGEWLLGGSPGVVLNVNRKEPVGQTVTMGFGGVAAIRVGDVGKYCYLYGGIVQIKTRASASSCTGEILKVLHEWTENPKKDPDPADEGTWTLEAPAWTAANGYPGAVALHDERLYLAGTDDRPVTVWGSKAGVYDDMGRGVIADDAVVYTLSVDQMNIIQWLASTGNFLMVGNAGLESRLTGGTDEPITPSNVLVRDMTIHGSKKAKPIRVGKAVVFIQRAGRKLRKLRQDFDVDNTEEAQDLNRLSRDVTQGGLTQISYAQEPDSQLYAVRGDGVLCVLTYKPDEEVLGWGRWVLGAPATGSSVIESIATLPHPDGDRDQTWVSVKRTINGATVRYVEYFEDAAAELTRDWTEFYTDSGLVYSGSAVTNITGADHLEGETVQVIADGIYVGTKVISGGALSVALAAAASEIEIGLGYESTLETTRPDIPEQGGVLGSHQQWSEVTALVKDTAGLNVFGDDLSFLTAEDFPWNPIPLYSGFRHIQNVGIDEDGRITIKQTLPLPATVLYIGGYLNAAR
jgi:hypothetical protein